jgi:hypothetical protein
MSALPLKADIRRRDWHVRLGPISDVGRTQGIELATDQLSLKNPLSRGSGCWEKVATGFAAPSINADW